MNRKKYFSHQTAVIDSGASIGENTKIWINCQIRENAIIGNNCNIGKDTYIDKGVRIGNDVKIQNGVSIYNGVIIEDSVFIGPYAVFTNDLYPRAFNNNWKTENTIIKKGASIGANATIVCGNEIGSFAMVGSGSVVTHSINAYALVIGNPARQIGWVCECGHKLGEDLFCRECKTYYSLHNNELKKEL